MTSLLKAYQDFINDESTLKDLLTYYGHEQLADFGKEEYEDDSEL
jgi:hypothetical protein